METSDLIRFVAAGRAAVLRGKWHIPFVPAGQERVFTHLGPTLIYEARKTEGERGYVVFEKVIALREVVTISVIGTRAESWGPGRISLEARDFIAACALSMAAEDRVFLWNHRCSGNPYLQHRADYNGSPMGNFTMRQCFMERQVPVLTVDSWGMMLNAEVLKTLP